MYCLEIRMMKIKTMMTYLQLNVSDIIENIVNIYRFFLTIPTHTLTAEEAVIDISVQHASSL